MERYYACESAKRIARIERQEKESGVWYALDVYQVDFSKFFNNSVKIDYRLIAIAECQTEELACRMMENFGLVWEACADSDEALEKVALLATLPEVV